MLIKLRISKQIETKSYLRFLPSLEAVDHEKFITASFLSVLNSLCEVITHLAPTTNSRTSPCLFPAEFFAAFRKEIILIDFTRAHP